MGLRQETKTIGDSTYRITQIPYGAARPIIWLAASVLLPAIEALGGWKLSDGTASLLDTDTAAIGKAFKVFFDRATEGDLERVEQTFAAHTLVRPPGARDFVALASVADLHWPNRYADMLAWWRLSIEVHFGPFSRASKRDADESAGAPTTP